MKGAVHPALCLVGLKDERRRRTKVPKEKEKKYKKLKRCFASIGVVALKDDHVPDKSRKEREQGGRTGTMNSARHLEREHNVRE